MIEILTVLFLAALVALPFTRMFSFGMQGSVDNAEHINAYNLAREKIEELKSMPYETIKSDFDNFQEAYNNLPEYPDVFGNPDKFNEVFSDIVTNDRLKDEKDKDVCERILTIYKQVYFREYDLYPDEFTHFRRITSVENESLGDTTAQPRLKKVSVRVFNRRGQKIAELVTLIGKHR